MRTRPLVTATLALAVGLAACGSTDDSESSTSTVTNHATVESTSSASTTAAPTTTAEVGSETTGSPPDTEASVEPARPELDRVSLGLIEVAELDQPVALAARPGTDDLYIVEQRGRIRRLAADGSSETVLDIADEVSGSNEQGLLGLAFDGTGDRLYINYTDRNGDTVVQRLEMAGNEVTGRETVIAVEQLRANHNGGHLAFGPDGYLYVGLGDGGGGGDPGDNGQNPRTLLGSMLRLDVSTPGEGYSVPSDNPFVEGGGSPEAFIWGLRNPWRYSFDPATGDLWIADVGQDRFEEVTVLRAADGGGRGANLGWNEMEGAESYRGGTEPADHVRPIIAYAQTGGRCSVTGGEVYRGAGIPRLRGAYVFGDFCTGEIFGIDSAIGGEIVALDIPRVGQLTSFGVDGSGELLALGREGGVFRIVEG